jgi:hypothetical protein
VGTAPDKGALAVVGAVPAPLSGVALTGIVVNTSTKTITADLPASGAQGYLTITPVVTITSTKITGGKLVITYQ